MLLLCKNFLNTFFMAFVVIQTTNLQTCGYNTNYWKE